MQRWPLLVSNDDYVMPHSLFGVSASRAVSTMLQKKTGPHEGARLQYAGVGAGTYSRGEQSCVAATLGGYTSATQRSLTMRGGSKPSNAGGVMSAMPNRKPHAELLC